MKPKGIVIGALATPLTLISEEEVSTLIGNDTIIPSAVMLVGEMTEEEQLALILIASTVTALEERAAPLASFIYDRDPSDLSISLFSHFSF